MTGTDSLASPNIYNEPALKEKRALLESVGISLFNSKYQEEFLWGQGTIGGSWSFYAAKCLDLQFCSLNGDTYCGYLSIYNTVASK